MEKRLALWFRPLPQVVVGYLLWVSMRCLLGLTPIPDGAIVYVAGTA